MYVIVSEKTTCKDIQSSSYISLFTWFQSYVLLRGRQETDMTEEKRFYSVYTLVCHTYSNSDRRK